MDTDAIIGQVADLQDGVAMPVFQDEEQLIPVALSIGRDNDNMLQCLENMFVYRLEQILSQRVWIDSLVIPPS